MPSLALPCFQVADEHSDICTKELLDKHSQRVCALRNVNELNPHGDSLCQAYPKVALTFCSKLLPVGFLRVPDSSGDAVYFTADWRGST
jgi:hypothetical protein